MSTGSKCIILIRNAQPHDFGGGERFPVFLSEALVHENFKPVIISRSSKLLDFAKSREQRTIKGWWWRKQQWSGIYNFLLPFYGVWQAILTLYYLVLFIRLQPQAVHIQSKDDFIAGTIAARILRTHVIWTDHADLKHIWKNISKPWKNPIGKCIYRLAKDTIAITLVSHSEKSFVTSELPPNSSIRGKLRVIYNGVLDTSSKYPPKSTDTTLSFLIASRLVTDKGIGEAITAFKQVHALHTNTILKIIGDGPEKKHFKASAADYPAIMFLGHRSDPLKYMAAADIFIHPTYHEGFSVALVEASMMSLPIIATAVGGNKEIILDRSTGLLVPVKDSSALAQAMQTLCKDKRLREQLGANARSQYLKKFQFDHIVRQSFLPLYAGELR